MNPPPKTTTGPTFGDLLTSNNPNETALKDAIHQLALAAPLWDPTPAIAAIVAAGEAARPHLEDSVLNRPKGATLKGRKALMTALVSVAGPSSGPAFFAGLAEINTALRETAQEGMATLGAEIGLPFVEAALEHRSARIRKSAARILQMWPSHPQVCAVAKTHLNNESRNGIRIILQEVANAQTKDMPPHEALGLLMNSVLMVETNADFSMGIANWKDRLSEGMPFLVYIFKWITDSGAIYTDPKERMWFGALKHNQRDRLAPWAAIQGLALDLDRTPRAYLNDINGLFGGRLRAPALHAIQTRHPKRVALYAHLIESKHNVTDDTHLAFLQDSSKRVRALAVAALAKRGETVVEAVVSLLSARKAPTRTAAAQCLELIGHNSAFEGLRVALDKERVASARAAIQTAMAACDPLTNDTQPQGH